MFMSFRSYLSKLAIHPTSTPVLKSLVSSAVEALEKKIAKWNKRLLFAAAYLDPVMRTQLDALNDITGVSMDMVSV